MTFETGTRQYAGTDATVFIRFIGKIGRGKELEFKDTNGKMFERGNQDVFTVNIYISVVSG